MDRAPRSPGSDRVDEERGSRDRYHEERPGPADRSVWNDVVAELESSVRTHAVDLRGSGAASAVPGPYTLERYAADLRELIESLELGPVVVVGHSMGATVALRLAVDAPEVVRALVLIAPIPAGGSGDGVQTFALPA